jgi:hypothetical protein
MTEGLSIAAHGLRQILAAYARRGSLCPDARTLRRKMIDYGYGSGYGAAWCELVDKGQILVTYSTFACENLRGRKIVKILHGPDAGLTTSRPLGRRRRRAA